MHRSPRRRSSALVVSRSLFGTALATTITIAASAAPHAASTAHADDPPPTAPVAAPVRAPVRAPAPAPAGKLVAGMPSPELAITEWLKGAPITKLERGTIYIVEFWATWCGPCVANIGHLNALQKEFGPKGLVVVGVTSLDPRNSLPAVKDLVRIRGDGMNYTVAWDATTATSKRFLAAAKLTGLPASFVVGRDGVIEYIGHPKALSLVIPKLVDGSWQRDRDTADIVKAEALEDRIGERSRDHPAEALAAFKELEAAWPRFAEQLLLVRADLERRTGDRAAWEKTLDQVEAKATRDIDFLGLRGIAVRSFSQKDEPGVLDRCLRVLRAANTMSAGEDSVTLRLLAKVHEARGEFDLAIDAMRTAIEHADGPIRTRLGEELRSLEAARAAAPRSKAETPPPSR